MSEFGAYLKSLRGKKSIRDVAKEVGISHTYLATLEKGIDPRTKKPRKPTPDVINKLATYYHVPNGDLAIKAGYDPFEYVNQQSDFTLTKLSELDVRYLLDIEDVAYYNGKELTKEQRLKAVAVLDALFNEN